MATARVGRHKAVYITYEIISAQGELLEKSDLPVGYVHRAGGLLLEKLEDGLEGCAVGESVEVPIGPEDGFGGHREELTSIQDLDDVPEEFHRLGAEAAFENERGETISMMVTEIKDGQVILDGNHPLAGKDLVFRVKVTSVRAATDAEIQSGVPADTSAPLQ
ncbi:MAG: peptidylprolyl isomerase [Gammaproteobacteria bacterium]|nr:MAG: peptidylprolyl isomerase [Gammaproteobacteria bacterium]